jgi:hypothetical protein
MSVRKAHNSGRNHLRNVVDYYQREYSTTESRETIDFAPLTLLEIGHEKAQSVIDSITSSYAAEGQAGANPMLPQNQPQNFGAPPFGFPGIFSVLEALTRDSTHADNDQVHVQGCLRQGLLEGFRRRTDSLRCLQMVEECRRSHYRFHLQEVKAARQMESCRHSRLLEVYRRTLHSHQPLAFHHLRWAPA